MAVKFIKTDVRGAEELIAKRLQSLVDAHKRVLWVVPGGSTIPLIARVMKRVSVADSEKLAIMLTDERFGPVGFPDSNLQQLYEAGFEPMKATVLPVLRPGVPLAQTTELFGEAAQVAIAAADYSFAIFGMGTDGHIAGILPGSPATKQSKAWAVAYETPEFTRITLTPFALSHLSEAMIVALGEPKKRLALEKLQKKVVATKQPAQLLKKLASFTVLNDQIGEES